MHSFIEDATASSGLPGNLVVGAQKTVVRQGWTVQKVQYYPQMAPAIDSGNLLQLANVTGTAGRPAVQDVDWFELRADELASP